MAEEKRRKIDLKARLGKGGVTPPPGGVPVPVPVPPPSAMASGGYQASGSNPGIPVPPGIPVGPPPFGSPTGSSPIDPNNPLSAMASPFRQTPAAPPQPQRIEVDDATVQQARKGALKQGIGVAAIAAVIALVVGYVAGCSARAGEEASRTVNDAKQLADEVEAAKKGLASLAEKLEAGITSLKQRKFPEGLAGELARANIDFDGGKLAGRRVAFAPETSNQLFEFISGVQGANDRRTVLAGVLSRLQKPLTEQLNAPPGQQTINYVVVLDKDPGNNMTALLAPISPSITFTPPNLQLPAELTVTNPLSGANNKVGIYKSGDVSRAASATAVYVTPKTFDKACPSEVSGQAAQLASQVSTLLKQVKGEQQQTGDQFGGQDPKPGLTQMADALAIALRKVGGRK